MNEEKIRIRRTCCQLLGKTGMQTVLTKRCDEQVLLEGCQKVLESEIAQNIKHLSADMQKRLMETPELLGYVLGLLQKGPSPRRVETLLKQIKMEELLNYNKERVAFILMNQGVADEHLLVYLRYYLDLNLSWDQQTLLKDGLRNYFSRRQNQEETFFIKNRKIF